MPLVSVVIPAYNAGEHLREAVDSVRSQTFTDWECVIVDDGSTEPLPDVSGDGVRVIRQQNRGVSAARNRGIREAQADLLAFLDADDVWLPEKLERQLSAMTAQTGLVACAFRFTDGRAGWAPGATDYEGLLGGNSINTCTVLARREALGSGFDEELAFAEDWDMWLRVAQHWRIGAISDELVLYRTHGGQASMAYRKMWLGSMRVLWKHRSTKGVRRMGQIYGSQAFDEFRRDHRPSHLFWATALWPGYVVRNGVDFARRRLARWLRRGRTAEKKLRPPAP